MYTFTCPDAVAVDTVTLTLNHSVPLGGPVGQVADLAPSNLGCPL